MILVVIFYLPAVIVVCDRRIGRNGQRIGFFLCDTLQIAVRKIFYLGIEVTPTTYIAASTE